MVLLWGDAEHHSKVLSILPSTLTAGGGFAQSVYAVFVTEGLEIEDERALCSPSLRALSLGGFLPVTQT